MTRPRSMSMYGHVCARISPANWFTSWLRRHISVPLGASSRRW
jgi:hypothetical protein